LLRYGIPDFKMEKSHIDRRVEQMQGEGVVFRTGVMIGDLPQGSTIANWSHERVAPADLCADFDAVLLAGGAEQSRDLPVPGRDLDGIHFAMEFLPSRTRSTPAPRCPDRSVRTERTSSSSAAAIPEAIASGTSNRHGAKSVTQFELMPMPPDHEDKPLVWPYWPTKLRTSSSHEEGCEREFAVATKEFIGDGRTESPVASRR
jgi:glutamate synthase (NADPH/NADH) small chain